MTVMVKEEEEGDKCKTAAQTERSVALPLVLLCRHVSDRTIINLRTTDKLAMQSMHAFIIGNSIITERWCHTYFKSSAEGETESSNKFASLHHFQWTEFNCCLVVRKRKRGRHCACCHICWRQCQLKLHHQQHQQQQRRQKYSHQAPRTLGTS